MKKSLLLVAIAALTLNMQAQPPADSTPTYPSGATYTHSSGTATINETTGIKTVKSEESKVKSCYTLDGRIATDSMKGIIIQDGKKFIRK